MAHGLIEIRVAELKQLFDAIDASPFGERDLDPRAQEFIVSWARELPRNAPLRLLVHLDRPAGPADENALLQGAVQGFFRQRARAARHRLRNLFRIGRISLLIGLTFLALAIVASDLIGERVHGGAVDIFRESLVIGGWVALWRPLEIFLYDWWPIRADARLADRLAEMPVEIRYGATADQNAWQRDWPAMQPARSSPA